MVKVCPKEPWFEGLKEPNVCASGSAMQHRRPETAGVPVEEVDGYKERNEAAAGGGERTLKERRNVEVF